MPTHNDITSFFHSKAATALMMAALAVCVAVALGAGAVVPVTDAGGLGLPAVSSWFAPGLMSAAASLMATALAVLMLVAINRWYNIMRRITAFVPTAFLMLQVAQPVAAGQFYGGTLLVVVMLLVVITLFSVYAEAATGQRNVFMAFLLIGFCSFFQVGFLFYFPILLLALLQLRVFTLRSILAAAMGLITPAWILLGFDIVSLSQLSWPEVQSVRRMFDAPELAQAVTTTAIVALVGIGFTVANLMKILSYNARVRSMNGVLTLMFLYTVLLIALNFNNFIFYVPLLNCTAAYQIGHFFSYHRHLRSYLAILTILAVCAACYFWALAA